ncbi:hypothetical protein BKA70DRAFT_1301364 [Coprinopsis sp. MPI-PUGE-AT-0042]|nr:hypothetical protein BKA70DRAFT_1301364 [Coprinopsis sp. MPI-PUGE-AT-0042]
MSRVWMQTSAPLRNLSSRISTFGTFQHPDIEIVACSKANVGSGRLHPGFEGGLYCHTHSMESRIATHFPKSLCTREVSDYRSDRPGLTPYAMEQTRDRSFGVGCNQVQHASSLPLFTTRGIGDDDNGKHRNHRHQWDWLASLRWTKDSLMCEFLLG